MAWRIYEHVVRGEIDCTVRGHVTGRIWFAGRNEPVALALTGCPARDLAGRRLEFKNPKPVPGMRAQLAKEQDGVVGDMTASRKCKVPDIPIEQVGEYFARREKFPWHWANIVYLEWFSLLNGRVVMEAPDFEIEVSTEATWTMTEAEEAEQHRANAAAMTHFFEQLGTRMADAELEPEGSTDESVDIDTGKRPQSEEEADRMMRESDDFVDRITARLEREGDDADYEKILEEELERRREERGEKPLTPEEEAEREKWIEEMNRVAEEAASDLDPLVEGESADHPLAERAQELAVRVSRDVEEHGWIPDSAQREHPVVELQGAIMCAAGKLAGALDGREWPPEVDDCALAISWLKRARGYLDDALLAADICTTEKLTGPSWLSVTRAEVAAIGTDVDAIITELRERLARGFD